MDLVSVILSRRASGSNHRGATIFPRGLEVAGSSKGRRDPESEDRAQRKNAVAVASVGDDHIQEQSGFVNPESFTHGTSEQREYWFANGYKNGLGVCDTFKVAGDKL